jgi:hypothetical protein
MDCSCYKFYRLSFIVIRQDCSCYKFYRLSFLYASDNGVLFLFGVKYGLQLL